MDIIAIVIIWAILLLVLVFSGMPIAFALGGLGFLAVYLWMGPDNGIILGSVAWSSIASFVLTAIVLYILMGTLFMETGLNEAIYGGVEPLICRILPGGLLHTNIIAGVIIGAMSGSMLSATVTGGTMSLPIMEKKGYDKGLAIGAICASGTLGTLIPPSITLIVYGAMTQTSVGQLFLAGVIPGLLCALLFMAYIAIYIKLKPTLVPKVEKLPWKVCLLKSLSIWPMGLVIFLVLGSIYTGLATPTEAASLGCVGIIVVAVILRKCNWNVLKRSAVEAVKLQGMLIFILIGGYLLTIAIRNLGVDELVTKWTMDLGSPILILLVVSLLYLIGGCFMDSLALLVATLPVTYPMIIASGYNPIWFGILITTFMMIGVLTPPVGVLLFTIKGLRPNYPFGLIVKGCLPFFCLILVLDVILYFAPMLVTWLPGLMIKAPI